MTDFLPFAAGNSLNHQKIKRKDGSYRNPRAQCETVLGEITFFSILKFFLFVVEREKYA